jgi:hypothetical protein
LPIYFDVVPKSLKKQREAKLLKITFVLSSIAKGVSMPEWHIDLGSALPE